MSDPISTKIQSDVEQLLARSLLYQLLAEAIKHPLSVEHNRLLKKDRDHWRDIAGRLRYPQQEHLNNLLEALLKEAAETDRGARIRQYEDCFGHTACGAVPGYELEYGEEHTHRQPQQLGDIAAFYQAFGLRLNPKGHERADHMGVECEFMQYLLLKEAYALANQAEDYATICRDASRRFFSEHLGRWGVSFSSRLAKRAQTGLMKHIADFAVIFLVQESALLGIAPGPYDLPIRAVRENEDTGCVNCLVKH